MIWRCINTNLVLEIAIAILVTGILADEEQSKTEIVVERVEYPMGNSSKLIRNINLRFKKFNRTLPVLDGSVEFLLPITNDMKVLK
jgi:hypothetical protein